MSKPIRMRNVLLALCLLILLPASAAGLSAPSEMSLTTPAPYVRGEVLVQWRDAATAASARRDVLQAGLTVLQEIPPLRVARLAVPSGQEWAYIERLRQHPLITYAEPNYLVYAAGSDAVQPNDPYWSRQWNMNRIEAPSAWALSTGQPGVSVALLDTGVDTGHPDLSGNLLAGYDFVNNDADPDDDHGHGTHVAGIIAAQLNNGVGVAGVAPAISILPLKVLNEKGEGDHFWVSQGISYAIANGARILNLSFAGPSSETLGTAVRNAYNAGALLVAATGNNGIGSVSYPAAYAEVLAVAATDYNDRWPSYSNWGPQVDLAAPGGTSGNQVWSTWRNGGYAWNYGTSMAVPHVSGAAALIRSVAPTLSRDEVANILRQSADQVGQFPYTGGRNDYLGYGRLNVHRALRQALPPTLTVQPAQLFFLGDSQQSPAAQQLTLSNESTQTLQWQAEKLSGGSWLNLIPPLSGNITYPYPARLWVMVTGGLDYGTYEGSIRISSSTLGAQGTPRTVPVRLILVPRLTRVYLPVVESR
ncbi:MAG: S8 family peptidase [Anaerolineae bacterium]|nr:S8 family peptidase [Anaerolineae bacterium]